MYLFYSVCSVIPLGEEDDELLDANNPVEGGDVTMEDVDQQGIEETQPDGPGDNSVGFLFS